MDNGGVIQGEVIIQSPIKVVPQPAMEHDLQGRAVGQGPLPPACALGGQEGPLPTSTCPFPWLETPCACWDSSTSWLRLSSMKAD